MRRWLVVLGLAGGRFDFDLHEVPASDAPVTDAVAFRGCDAAAPFGTPAPIAELNDPTADDGTLRLLPDELSGYFWSYRNGTTSNLYFASRPDAATPFTVALVHGLDPSTNAVDPTLAPDGTMMVFRHNPPGDDLWTATLASPTQLTGAAVDAHLSGNSSDVQPFWQVGGNTLYFSSRRSGGGDLYRSHYTGAFSNPDLVTELSLAASEEGDPVIAPDGLTIYFRSDRPSGNGGPQMFNIWTASRTTTDGTFGPAVLVPNVNSNADEGPSWLSLDGCRLYLSSDRAGTNDLYVATRGT